MNARIGGSAALLAMLLTFAPAHALDYQLHGFAAQGLVNSEGNDYYGDSTRTSLDYYEAGLNGSLDLGHRVLLSAQGLLRDAGATDDGQLRLDYALLDYAFIDSSAVTAGLRAGRVKNPLGFYNDARDVVFTRPGILMPQLYLDSVGLRSLLFSSDGGQLYGRVSAGAHELSAIVGAARDRDLSDLEKRQLAGSNMLNSTDVDVEDLRFARLQDEIASIRTTLAFSVLDARLAIEPGNLFSGALEAELYVLSARYDAEHFSLISEYALQRSRSRFPGLGISDKNTGDSLYVQLDWRLRRDTTLYLRHDMSFSDRGDRNGRDYARETGQDRHDRFSHDSTLGLSWRYGAHWGLWLEAHLIDGTAAVPNADNIGALRDPHWSLFVAMLGYRF